MTTTSRYYDYSLHNLVSTTPETLETDYFYTMNDAYRQMTYDCAFGLEYLEYFPSFKLISPNVQDHATFSRRLQQLNNKYYRYFKTLYPSVFANKIYQYAFTPVVLGVPEQ